MAFRQGPYQAFVELPVPPRPVICSAAKIDAQSSDYVLDTTTGGFEAMPSTAQRVLQFVTGAQSRNRSGFITPQNLEANRLGIIAALSPMTDGPSPAIKLLVVTAISTSPGRLSGTVQFTDLTTGLDQTVQV